MECCMCQNLYSVEPFVLDGGCVFHEGCLEYFYLQRKLKHAMDMKELEEMYERMQSGRRDRQVEDVVADFRAKRLEFETRLNEELAVSERRLERIGELERENVRLRNEIDTVWRRKVKTLQQRVRRLEEKNRELKKAMEGRQ